MDHILSLSSSLSISKPFHSLPIPLSNKHQRPDLHMQFGVSCRATKVPGVDETIHGHGHGNFYKILSLSPKSATMNDIKRAYRSMALRYHPDVCHDPSMKEESTRMFVQLNTAYETLSNPRLRAEYDCELGLRSKMSVSEDDHEISWRCRWQEQVVELKRRSHTRMAQKEGSWGSRMRAQNMKKHPN